MLKKELKQNSFHSVLYNRIPEKHILKRINNSVDFSFINDLLCDSYSKYYGRPAKEPEMLARLSAIQSLYDLSDEDVIEEAAVNLAFMWFIGINPDEKLPDASLLSKFRTKRLKLEGADNIITETVKQWVEKGLIKDTGVSIDATHVVANTIKKTPERIMKHLAIKIMKNLKLENEIIPESVNTNIPDYKQIEDHKIAKQTMKDYLETLIEQVENSVQKDKTPKTYEAIETSRNILGDPKFMDQKGIRSITDQDARVGYKSKTDSFYGYKTEYAMTPEERIITAVDVHDGAYVDGTGFKELYEKTKECGMDITAVYGDKAYFRKPILDILKNDHVEAIIPVSASVYKIDDTQFTYNKDSDQWFCIRDNYTVSKKDKKTKKGNETLTYYFDKEVCRTCPNRKECNKDSTIAKRLIISVNTPEFYEYSQIAKTDEFKEKYKKRASHEWKNAELKRFHGMVRARGYGLKSMGMQARLAAFAVNLKRIANIVSSLNYCILIIVRKVVLRKNILQNQGILA